MCREIDSKIALTLTELSQEQQQEVEQYIEGLLEEIHDLNCQINCLEGEVEDLSNEVDDLENEHRECEFCESNYKGMNHPIAQIVQEIIDNQYYITNSYDSKNKVIQRLEHALRYECE